MYGSPIILEYTIPVFINKYQNTGIGDNLWSIWTTNPEGFIRFGNNCIFLIENSKNYLL